jgi:tetratricopeptide (TPR) repeat protein
LATLAAQEAQLANQYYRDGEYEKAAVLYEKLYKQNERNSFYFDRYVEAMLNLEAYDDVEKAIKKQLRRDPNNVNLYVSYGRLYERRYQDEKAQEQYRLAIERLPRDQYAITRLANTFSLLTKYDLAIATYERDIELLREPEAFAYNLAELYRRQGDAENMVNQYLNSLDYNPARINQLKTMFQRYFSEDDFEELQRQLYARIQRNDKAMHYPELLSWVFVQKKDYTNALRQAKALDRKLRENGGRVFQLAQIALNDKDYDAAIDGFEYIVERKGKTSTYYLDAKRDALRARRYKLVGGYDYTREDLLTLEREYEAFLDEFGCSRLTAGIVLEYAELEAFFLNDLDKAIALLDDMIQYPNVDKRIQAEGKLDLADFYLMKGEVWEATLLYSQVDKDFKESVLGHEARFRNARLSYFAGDFQWAQAQFEVLKASTSKLIANDALDLSVFIMDNLGLDTTEQAMQWYADAELLVFQNRFGEAFAKMDTLLAAFPEHKLQDDVWYLKAAVYQKKREWEQAAAMLQRILEEYPDDIRADNALYELAELYENQLSDIEKAKALYERLFIEYSGSTFAVEARKRYRRLRGDDV